MAKRRLLKLLFDRVSVFLTVGEVTRRDARSGADVTVAYLDRVDIDNGCIQVWLRS